VRNRHQHTRIRARPKFVTAAQLDEGSLYAIRVVTPQTARPNQRLLDAADDNATCMNS